MIRRFALVSLALVFMMAGQANPSAASGSRQSAVARARLAAPHVSVRLSPITPAPGDVMITRVAVDAGSVVTGDFAGRTIRFAPDEPAETTEPGAEPVANFIGLLGLDALFPPGVYTLTLTAISPDGSAAQTLRPVRVLGRRAYLENVRLSQTLSATLDPVVNEEEALAFTQMYAGFSELKWWDGPMRWPVRGRIVAVYGNRRAYNGVNLGTFHGGLDISAAKGTLVKAAAPGRVVAVRMFAVHGLAIVLDHGRGVFTNYSHLSQADVQEGQMVNVGDVIGRVGTTGRSQGPHLHFELAVGGVAVDPDYWMQVALP